MYMYMIYVYIYVCMYVCNVSMSDVKNSELSVASVTEEKLVDDNANKKKVKENSKFF
jgi:hypothetical protein